MGRKNYSKAYRRMNYGVECKSININFKIILMIFMVLGLFLFSLLVFYYAVGRADVDENHDTENSYILNVKKKNLYTDFKLWNENANWSLMVINDLNEVKDDFKVELKKYRGIDVDERIIPYLNDMMNAAEKDGIKLWISSGYRSFERQSTIFERKVKENLNKGYGHEEAVTLASGVVAKPGTSEHHTGLAVDLNGVRDDFCDTKEYEWLINNCAKYGFILRYGNDKQRITGKIYEPWHYRYVGEEHAKKMQESGICLEEYVSELMN